MESIQFIFDDFINKNIELQKIKKDIMNYQSQFKERMKELKTAIEKDSEYLKKYLDDNNLPGIKKQSSDGNVYVITAEDIPTPFKKDFKEKKLKNLFTEHQIDPNSRIYKEVVDIVNSNRNIEVVEKKIKFKKYNE
jgi:hypothetical protein